MKTFDIRPAPKPFIDRVKFPYGFKKSGDFSIPEADLLTRYGKTLCDLESGTLSLSFPVLFRLRTDWKKRGKSTYTLPVENVTSTRYTVRPATRPNLMMTTQTKHSTSPDSSSQPSLWTCPVSFTEPVRFCRFIHALTFYFFPQLFVIFLDCLYETACIPVQSQYL